MKKTLRLIAALWLVTLACKTTDNVITPDTPGQVDMSKGEVTPVGKPVGQPVTATIGPVGGSIVIADGNLTLEIPSGALEKEERISLQLVESTVPGSLGFSFVVEPRNLKLKKPVFINWHYGTDGMNGTQAQFVGMAYQDASGVWLGKLEKELDPAKQTIRTRMPDFLHPMSYYSQFWLIPPQGFLLPNQRIELKAYFEPNRPADEEDGLFVPIGDSEPLDHDEVTNWLLNGQAHPSEATTRISGTLDPLGTRAAAIYTAPKAVPPKGANPASISVELNLPQRGKIILVSNLTIKDPQNTLTVGGITIRNPEVTVVTEGDGMSFTISELPANPENRKVILSGLIDGTVFDGTGTYEIKGYEWGLSHVNVNAYDREYSYAPRWIPAPSQEAWGPGSITISEFGDEGKPITGTVNATLHTYMDTKKSWKHVTVSAKFQVISNYHAGSGGRQGH